MAIKETKEGFNEFTILKVYDALREAGLGEEDSRDCIVEMHNKGLVFREKFNEGEVVPPVINPPRSNASMTPKKICPYDGKAFLKTSTLEAHMRQDHKGDYDNDNVINITKNNRTYPLLCPLCGLPLNSPEEHRAHAAKSHGATGVV